MAEDHRSDGRGHAFTGKVDAGAAVVGVDLRILAVVGVLGIDDDALHQVAVKVEGVKVHALGLAAVELVVHDLVIAQADAGAKGGQQLVLGLGHLLGGLDGLIVLIVIAPAADDHLAAGLVEGGDGGKFLGRVGLGIGLRSSQTAGRRG